MDSKVLSKLPEPYYQTDDGMQTIYCGDSLELLPLMEPESVDLVLTDPPYVVEAPGGGIAGDRAYLHEIITQKLNKGFDMGILDRFRNWFCFCGKQQIVELLQRAQEECDNWMLLTWCKTNPTPLTNNNYLPDCEYIIHKYAPGRLFGEYADKSRFIVSTTGKSEFDHPTVKPIPILKKLLTLGSKAGDTMLDPYLGSGSTLVACQQLGRWGIGIEIEEKYCEIAKKRLAQYMLPGINK